MSLSTPNSSFILDRLRRSIRLCAVFLAILRPAAVVPAVADFLLLPAFAADLVSPVDTAFDTSAAEGASCAQPLGFICMILRDLVGGGGSAKSSLLMTDPPLGAICWRPTTWSGEVGRYELCDESEPVADGEVELVVARPWCSW